MQLDLVLKFAPFPRCMALHVAVLSLGVRTAQDPGAWRGGGGGWHMSWFVSWRAAVVQSHSCRLGTWDHDCDVQLSVVSRAKFADRIPEA